MSFTSLPNELINHITSFSNRETVMALAGVDKKTKENLNEIVYQKVFGEMKQPQQLEDKTIMTRLISYAKKQPDVAENHNTHTPSNFFQRWKWMLGLETSLDKDVQKIYNENIRVLENTQATSIIQLKNQHIAFWHTDRQIKDYIQSKADAKAQATNNILGKIFFACVEGLLKLFYKSSALKMGTDLEHRSYRNYAKIGDFEVNGKKYDVAAFHAMDDDFKSCYTGKTAIGIFERGQPIDTNELGAYGKNPNFNVLIGRETSTGEILEENAGEDHVKVAVSNSKRHLVLKTAPEYRDRPTEAQKESDRLIDQKMTQIMIEMAKQNRDITSVHMKNSDPEDGLFLAASGFETDHQETLLSQLQEFRSKEGIKLFNYNNTYLGSTSFKMENLDKQNIFYSRETPESWSEIIARAPILNRGAGILPEYWAKKPNLAAG